MTEAKQKLPVLPLVPSNMVEVYTKPAKDKIIHPFSCLPAVYYMAH
jgi:hypothetical protein